MEMYGWMYKMQVDLPRLLRSHSLRLPLNRIHPKCKMTRIAARLPTMYIRSTSVLPSPPLILQFLLANIQPESSNIKFASWISLDYTGNKNSTI